MQLSVELVLAIAGTIISAQSAAIVWLAKQLVHCWEARADSDQRGLETARTGAAQTERAVRAGRELTR